jgi:hypothetical protein
LICRNGNAADLVQNVREYPELVWNHFKTPVFPLHPHAASNIRLERITEGLLP